LEILL